MNTVYHPYQQKEPGELTVNQGAPYWISIDHQQEQELFDRVSQSTKIQKQKLDVYSKTQAEGAP